MIRRLTTLFFMHMFLLCFTQTKPAESYSLIRGVNENVNLNTGTVNLNLPLFDITEGKFTLNNTLNYESRGFVPYITPAYVGLNWNMIQFGKITRESRRIDLTTTNQINRQVSTSATRGSSILPNYAAVGMQYEKYDCLTTSFDIGKLEIYNISAVGNSAPKSKVPNSSESYTANQNSFEPDKFYFDFMGYKGYFIIDNDGRPIVYCENAVLKVDITNYGFHNIFENITFSEIKLMDDKGNQFFFGGDKNTLDISFSFNTVEYESWDPEFGPYSGAAKTKTNYIDSWSLKKIILNDGSEINAYYQASDLTVLNNYRNTDNLKEYISNLSYDSEPNFPSRQELINSNVTAEIVESFNNSMHNTPIPNTYLSLETWTRNSTLTKKAVLDSIKIGNTVVDYKYQKTTNPLELTGKYLTEINVKRNSNLVKKINLGYQNYGNTNKRTLLTSVQNSVGENISLEYYNTDDFPPYIKAHTNDLGFWNGDMKNYGPYPTGINGYYDSGIEDFTAYDTGLLRKITYPTKGSTSYLYQKGAYSKKYADAFDYTDMPKLKDENGVVNAPVLYKKIEVDNNNQNIETVYKYENDNGTNSGIIEGSVEYQSINGSYLTSNQNLNPNLNSQNSLHYSTVTVTNPQPWNGYTKYRFTDRITNPDSLTNKLYKYGPYAKEFQNRDLLFLSKAYERGKIIKEELYNLLGIKVKETEYKYKNFLKKLPTIDLLNTNCSTCKASDANYYVKVNDYPSNYHLQTQYIPVLPYLLVSQTTSEDFGGFMMPSELIETSKKITYSDNLYFNNALTYWHPFPIEEKIINSKGTAIRKYLYPTDLLKNSPCPAGGCNSSDNTIVGGQYEIYEKMLSKNMLLPLIEITKNPHDKYTLKESLPSSITLPTSESFVIKKKRQSLLDSNLSFTSYKIPVSDVIDDVSYEVYDNKLNVIQASIKTSIPNTTIYGYNQTLPIAQIAGITYAQLMQIFNLPNTPTGYLGLDIVKKSDLDKNSETENVLLLALDNFRTNSNLANYEITTYTYDPLVGVTTVTSPSGIKETYKRDSFHRLNKILDSDKNIVKEYNYNYSLAELFYNGEQSRVFSKTDCTVGYSPASYTYTVPRGIYSSTISEADANQKAITDINTNGQTIANQNLVCSPGCPITLYNAISASYMNIYSVGNKVTFQLQFNSGNVVQWNNGASIGTMQGDCKPGQWKTIYYTEPNSNSSWQIQIDPIGNVQAKLLSGFVPNTINFQFEFYK
ncbi:YD repeat-containing protein [Chryseobacterium oleae]|uniref:YD repeat-containing protein n=1 Tax=Chryseobacterium oleae TaxID=491207 RepID=A0A1I4YWN9_CHROL|nr:DUF5977 domain-containing protein [Chryseobacterium oleae]SFN42421.1 YD repeat-containing protein [Chryseobacterium oleae]